MNEVVREFLLETHENLAQLDLDLVTLERDPHERETLARVFRTLHTVKGTAGFLGLPKLESVAHAAENLLSRLRAGSMIFNPEIAGALLSVVDAIRTMTASIEQTGDEGDGDYSAVIQTLEQLLEQGAVSSADQKAVAAPAPPTVPATPSEPSPPVRPVATWKSEQPTPTTPPLVTNAASQVGQGVAESLSELVEPRAVSVADSAIRVDVGLLDKLMTLVGELVLARNQIMQFSTSQEDPAFLDTVQRLNLLTTELQAGVMKTRMQPIGNIWSKFPRIVRDLAVACGKQARIEMEGQETELDKTIVESIRDPLTHLVRNAIDHGLEPPQQRLALGKPAEGRLSLHAFHEGGKVIIEISDDGAGIDLQRVADKAVQAKLVSPQQISRMSERELLNLIFLPGFSTADRVTNFSGRGVGMDVVRTNVEKIGGTVDLESRPGRGTTMKMKIPLTLAIIPALTVTSGGDRYAIPQVNLLELVRLDAEQLHKVERIHTAPVYRLRGNLLPLVYLHQLLNVEPSPGQRDELNIVVLQADDRQFGLVVDAIHDTEEIVVKPLQKPLKGISAFAGATIMGDGKVALILDVLGLAQLAQVVTDIRERVRDEQPIVADGDTDRQTVLLIAPSPGERMAIPLAQVARLEVFPRAALERVGGQFVVQYRQEILPLISVSRILRRLRHDTRQNGRPRLRNRQESSLQTQDRVQVVVHAGPHGQVGLMVASILDVVEENLVSRSRPNRPGILFNAVVQGQVTEFLDLETIFRALRPETFSSPQPVGSTR